MWKVNDMDYDIVFHIFLLFSSDHYQMAWVYMIHKPSPRGLLILLQSHNLYKCDHLHRYRYMYGF